MSVSVQKLNKSESGQNVFQKVKSAYSCDAPKVMSSNNKSQMNQWFLNKKHANLKSKGHKFQYVKRIIHNV